ncbi:hypothetical protein Tco_0232328 [Tanacetum coccineum]
MCNNLNLRCYKPSSQRLNLSLSAVSILSIAPNLLRGGNKSIGMESNAGTASANSASAGATCEGDLHLLRDGPIYGEGVGDGDGGAVAHLTIAARVVRDKRGCGRNVFLGPCIVSRALYGAMEADKEGVQNLAALKIVSNQAVRADLAVSDSAKIQVIPAYNIHEDLKALFLDGDVVPYGLGSRGQKYRINMEDNS